MIAWVNGSIRPFSEAAVPVWDLGVVAGACVTEMARTFGHRPFRLARHVERLTQALDSLGFPQLWSSEQLIAAAQQVVQHNTGLIASDQDLGIVLFSTAGTNPTYLAGDGSGSTTIVHTFPLPFSLWRESLLRGVRLNIPGVRQVPHDCFPVSFKVRNRLHWWLADREASRIEPGSKALLLDHERNVTETSTACFFIVSGGKIVTSDRSVLLSLSAEVVEELAAALRIPFERRPIREEELQSVEEAFLSSTPVCLLPVSTINGHAAGSEIPGPVFRNLSQAWSERVGLKIADQILGDL